MKHTVTESKGSAPTKSQSVDRNLNKNLKYRDFPGGPVVKNPPSNEGAAGWVIKKAREFQKNIYFCFINYAKAFDFVDHKKMWKILKEMGIPDHLTYLLRNLYEGQQLELDMEQQTGSKSGKEYIKAVYCHPAYLIYMQSTSCEMPGWMKHKLKSRLPGEISITSDMQMTPPLWQKVKN